MSELGSVYRLVDPRTEMIRYIGATRRPLKVRLGEHISSPNSARMARWFTEMALDGLLPRIEMVVALPLSAMRAEEIDQTEAHLRDGWPLLNVGDLPGDLWWADIDLCHRRIARCAPIGGPLLAEARGLLDRAIKFKAAARELHRRVSPSTLDELDTAVRLKIADRRDRGSESVPADPDHEAVVVAAIRDVAIAAKAYGIPYGRTLGAMLSTVIIETRPEDAVSKAVGAAS